ncbi:MAG: hypothetical protein WC300_06265, partial [Candidatus Omnitrophota bacterium]
SAVKGEDGNYSKEDLAKAQLVVYYKFTIKDAINLANPITTLDEKVAAEKNDRAEFIISIRAELEALGAELDVTTNEYKEKDVAAAGLMHYFNWTLNDVRTLEDTVKTFEGLVDEQEETRNELKKILTEMNITAKPDGTYESSDIVRGLLVQYGLLTKDDASAEDVLIGLTFGKIREMAQAKVSSNPDVKDSGNAAYGDAVNKILEVFGLSYDKETGTYFTENTAINGSITTVTKTLYDSETLTAKESSLYTKVSAKDNSGNTLTIDMDSNGNVNLVNSLPPDTDGEIGSINLAGIDSPLTLYKDEKGGYRLKADNISGKDNISGVLTGVGSFELLNDVDGFLIGDTTGKLIKGIEFTASEDGDIKVRSGFIRTDNGIKIILDGQVKERVESDSGSVNVNDTKINQLYNILDAFIKESRNNDDGSLSNISISLNSKTGEYEISTDFKTFQQISPDKDVTSIIYDFILNQEEVVLGIVCCVPAISRAANIQSEFESELLQRRSDYESFETSLNEIKENILNGGMLDQKISDEISAQKDRDNKYNIWYKMLNVKLPAEKERVKENILDSGDYSVGGLTYRQRLDGIGDLADELSKRLSPYEQRIIGYSDDNSYQWEADANLEWQGLRPKIAELEGIKKDIMSTLNNPNSSSISSGVKSIDAYKIYKRAYDALITKRNDRATLADNIGTSDGLISAYQALSTAVTDAQKVLDKAVDDAFKPTIDSLNTIMDTLSGEMKTISDAYIKYKNTEASSTPAEVEISNAYKGYLGNIKNIINELTRELSNADITITDSTEYNGTVSLKTPLDIANIENKINTLLRLRDNLIQKQNEAREPALSLLENEAGELVTALGAYMTDKSNNMPNDAALTSIYNSLGEEINKLKERLPQKMTYEEYKQTYNARFDIPALNAKWNDAMAKRALEQNSLDQAVEAEYRGIITSFELEKVDTLAVITECEATIASSIEILNKLQGQPYQEHILKLMTQAKEANEERLNAAQKDYNNADSNITLYNNIINSLKDAGSSDYSSYITHSISIARKRTAAAILTETEAFEAYDNARVG